MERCVVAVKRVWLPLLWVMICGVVEYLPAYMQVVLVFQRDAVLQGEYWRLWSAHITHYTAEQCWVNSAMFALLWYVLTGYVSQRRMLFCILLAMPLILLGVLYGVPNMQQYRGISALDGMLWVWLACELYRRGDTRAWGIAALCLFVVRLGMDVSGLRLSELPAMARVAWQAHALGGLLGVVSAYVARFAARVF